MMKKYQLNQKKTLLQFVPFNNMKLRCSKSIKFLKFYNLCLDYNLNVI